MSFSKSICLRRILTGLQHQINYCSLVIYLQKLDEYRAELVIPRPPRGTIIQALPAQVDDAHKPPLPKASHRVKLICDKHWCMGNEAKAFHTFFLVTYS